MVEINNLKHLPLKSQNLTINSPCPEPKPGQTAHAPHVQLYNFILTFPTKNVY